MDLRGSVLVATCMETLVHSTHCVHNRQSFSQHQKLSAEQYPFWNTWSQRLERKTLTVLETARLSVKDKKLNVFYIHKRKLSVSCTGKMKEWKNVVSDRIWAKKTSLQIHIFSHQFKQTCLSAFFAVNTRNISRIETNVLLHNSVLYFPYTASEVGKRIRNMERRWNENNRWQAEYSQWLHAHRKYNTDWPGIEPGPRGFHTVE